MPLRESAIILALVLGVHAGDIWRVAHRSRASESGGANVVLVVADGLRWQEVFTGADSALLHGDAKAVGGDGAAARHRYWRPTARERREALMPFVWSTIAREGQLYGNRAIGSEARVTNPMKFSYPGYNEMLVGYPDARIDRNDYGPNPNVTVFEWINRRDGLEGRVAAFGMWPVFRDIFNVRRSGLPVGDYGTDAATHSAATHYLERQRPRALFVGFGATDDLAHKGRYDLTLDAAHAIDGYLSQLWSALQSMPQYRERTTLIFVADHGRGRSDWTSHGADIPGSDETWLAMIGPNVAPLGERHRVPPITLAQTAATVAAALGLDYSAEVTRAAPPVTARGGRVAAQR